MGVFSKQLEDIKIIPNLFVQPVWQRACVRVCVCPSVCVEKAIPGVFFFHHEVLRAAVAAAAGAGVHAHPQCTGGGHRRGGRLL